MSMERDQAKNLYPAGTDRLTVLDGELVMVSVVEHLASGAVVVAKKADTFAIPYADLQWSVA